MIWIYSHFASVFSLFFPEAGWSVQANDREYCQRPEFQKKVFLCIKKSKYSVSISTIIYKIMHVCATEGVLGCYTGGVTQRIINQLSTYLTPIHKTLNKMYRFELLGTILLEISV